MKEDLHLRLGYLYAGIRTWRLWYSFCTSLLPHLDYLLELFMSPHGYFLRWWVAVRFAPSFLQLMCLHSMTHDLGPGST